MTESIESTATDFPNPDDTFNAGELGCGELIVKLNFKLKRLELNQVLHLIAYDSGAIADIPAWCDLTGHRLVNAQHPHYYIARTK